MTEASKWALHKYLLPLLVILLTWGDGKTRVSCFNGEGHEAIGMVAMSGIKSEQLYELKKLLSGKDIVDIGKWGHLVHDKIKGAESMHFNLQSNDCKKAVFKCENENGLCLINSIKHFYGRLAGGHSGKQPAKESAGEPTGQSSEQSSGEPSEQPTGQSSEQPTGQPSEQPTEQDASNSAPPGEKAIPFKYPKNIAFTDADSLKYLVSLIADMHQPLRIAYRYDNGGKDIKVIHHDDYKTVKTNLFDYMESELINKMINRYQSAWYGGWTHVNRLFDEHKKDEKLFSEKGINAIDIWGEQIVNEFCSEFYLNSYVTNFMVGKDNELHFDTSKEIEITYDLEFHLERLLKVNILRAGSRIAIVLNSLFANRKFSSLRKKSEFDRVEYEQLERHKTASVYKKNAIFINLAIIFIVLAVILYFNFIFNRKNKMYLPSKTEEVELQAKCN
ncbi:S1/P1nuclease [Plasmodium cynomolgi strain B]|uniref:S1/P1nuclease n=1 Tax=Plasmodium cynomolgi (strain B) TaxID=1120755 RepID=K6UCY4_PLACD|nr:S1/P1nuclease [Plasmodium cynomolgi strain B]GAB65656.1 S1/P1nuclease [Plasmodium cynomolgi strain B]